MKTRFLGAAILLPLFVFLYLGSWPLAVLVAVISIIGTREFYKGCESLDIKPCYAIGYASAILLFMLNLLRDSISFSYIGLWLFVVTAASLIYGFKVEKRKLEDVISTAFGAIYVQLLLEFVVLIDQEFGIYKWLIVLIAFGTDIFAYFTGYFIGKHKLCPTLSPKKTIEGAVGGIVFAILFTVLFVKFAVPDTAPVICFAVIGLIVSVMSQFGDLSASAMKRRMGIKDYGNLIPGHGGILDRFDSIIFAAPSLYFLLYITFDII